MSEMSTTTLLTMPEAAEQMGVSARYVRSLVAQHEIPVVRLGRLVRFHPGDLEQYISEHRHAPVPIGR